MQKAFRYLLYPNRQQSEAMTGLLDSHRHLYNSALAERKAAYEEKRTVGYQEQSAHLKTTRKENTPEPCPRNSLTPSSGRPGGRGSIAPALFLPLEIRRTRTLAFRTSPSA